MIIDVTTAAAFRPPIFAEISVSNAPSDVTLFKTPGTPGLELSPHDIRMQIAVEDHMQVIRAAVDLEQFPAANFTMTCDRGLYEFSLFWVKTTGVFGHSHFCNVFAELVRGLTSDRIQYPSAFVSRQPCAVGRPRQKKCQWIRHWTFIRTCSIHAILSTH